MRSAMEEVARAAIEWNRSRLQRIAVRNALPKDVFSSEYSAGFPALDEVRKKEAAAKAALRRACMNADPSCQVFDVSASPPKLRLTSPDIIDI